MPMGGQSPPMGSRPSTLSIQSIPLSIRSQILGHRLEIPEPLRVSMLKHVDTIDIIDAIDTIDTASADL